MTSKSACAHAFQQAVESGVEKKGTVCKTFNSKVLNHGRKITYQLHTCPIVRVNRQKRLAKLSTCGYHTKTTKDHINLALSQISNKRITQKAFIWRVGNQPFSERMVVRY